MTCRQQAAQPVRRRVFFWQPPYLRGTRGVPILLRTRPDASWITMGLDGSMEQLHLWPTGIFATWALAEQTRRARASTSAPGGPPLLPCCTGPRQWPGALSRSAKVRKRRCR